MSAESSTAPANVKYGRSCPFRGVTVVPYATAQQVGWYLLGFSTRVVTLFDREPENEWDTWLLMDEPATGRHRVVRVPEGHQQAVAQSLRVHAATKQDLFYLPALG